MELDGAQITAVVTRDVIPGRERDYEEWARRAVSVSARYGATDIRSSLLTPVSPHVGS